MPLIIATGRKKQDRSKLGGLLDLSIAFSENQAIHGEILFQTKWNKSKNMNIVYTKASQTESTPALRSVQGPLKTCAILVNFPLLN